MMKIFISAFWTSVVCIVLSFFLLLLFKLMHLSAPAFACITAVLAFIGGALLIVSSIYLFLRKDLASAWAGKLLFHLPELIVLGLVSMLLGVVLLVGKTIK